MDALTKKLGYRYSVYSAMLSVTLYDWNTEDDVWQHMHPQLADLVDKFH